MNAMEDEVAHAPKTLPFRGGKMQRLLEYLGLLSPGQIADVGQLDSLLANCWQEFDGSHAEGMEPEKLFGRMERIIWDPPVLSFTIERHGGTVLGSSVPSFSTGKSTWKPVQPRAVMAVTDS